MPNGTYAEEREELRGDLTRLASLAEELDVAMIADAARALDAKLRQERFNVVVLGEFKRGKTTFVNALLGADILPTAVVPLTSIVTVVTWGEEVSAEITFLDGRTEQVEPSALARYVTEPENPENRLGIERALLRFPAEDLRDGVFLVDTPGVGSVYLHNSETARAFVSEADAVVFLTAADPPISASEREFLSEIREETPKTLFVLNKVDRHDASDLDEALGFTRDVLRSTLGSDVELYPLSAQQALEAKRSGDAASLEASGLPAFERDFRRFLLEEKGRTLLGSVRLRARNLVGDLRIKIDVEEHAARLPVAELDRAREAMEEVFEHAQRSRDDLHVLLLSETERLVRTVEGHLEELRAREEEALRRKADGFLGDVSDLRRARQALNALVKETLREGIDRWRTGEERTVADAFRASTVRFTEETDRIAAETVRSCGEILGLSLSTRSGVVEALPQTRFTYGFFEVPTILESILPDVRGYLPKKTGRRIMEKDMNERIPMLVDKHCGRLRWDFVQRLDRSRIALERALDERLTATIESLRRAVARSEIDRRRTESEARSAEERAEVARRELADIERLLERGSAETEAQGASR
jgi:signal recognition particle receptor subunit beta